MSQGSRDPFDSSSRPGFASRRLQKWRLESLHRIAEAHLQSDLHQSDRDLLQQASKKVSLHYALGAAIGLGLGALIAFRVRGARAKSFQALAAQEKPKEIVFDSGRTVPIPDVTSYLQPSTSGKIITYAFFSGLGLLTGSELGLLSGASAAARTVDSDPEAKKRILDAFRKFRIDVLKKEIEDLENLDPAEGWRVLGR